MRRTVVVGIALLLAVLTGCTGSPAPGSSPSPDQDTPDAAAQALVAAIGAGDLSGLIFAARTGAEADTDYAATVKGLGERKPVVTLGSLSRDGDTATVTISYRWPIADGLEWSYQANATMTRSDGAWRPVWAATVVNPDLAEGDRLSLRRSQAGRGDLLGTDARPIMTNRDVRRYGIDKSVAKDEAESSAAALARLVDVDPKTFAAKVEAAGSEAFVEAITYRADDRDRPALTEVDEIAGARVISGTAVLSPDRDFARALIGTVGEATAEIVEGSKGAIAAGDQTGLSGLQKRYDAQLRGQPAYRVVALPAVAASPSASPVASPSSSGSASGSASSSGSSEPRELWSQDAEDGTAVTISLDTELQTAAEKLLASVKPASAIVAIKPSTGEILAAANGPGAKGQALATTAQYAPGSTFKVVTVLALLRAGLTPTTKVSCPRTIVVDGRKFKNYDDYPASGIGTITLTEAVANSCNTAFIGLRSKVSTTDLRDAAEALGVGRDYDAGFASYFGEVPDDKTETGHAAAMIGQGKVTMSPMAMAQVAASVESGHTVVANLVEGTAPKAAGSTLTSAEAKQLRAMMGAVVTQGSGRVLSGLATGAKTGTAEYGSATPPKTHAWMIAYADDLAVAVFVADGDSGSGTAGPILKSFLQDFPR